MGWASGSSVLVRVWLEVRPYIKENQRVAVLTNLMDVFSDEDCDTLDEVIDKKWPESKLAYEFWSERYNR